MRQVGLGIAHALHDRELLRVPERRRASRATDAGPPRRVSFTTWSRSIARRGRSFAYWRIGVGHDGVEPVVAALQLDEDEELARAPARRGERDAAHVPSERARRRRCAGSRAGGSFELVGRVGHEMRARASAPVGALGRGIHRRGAASTRRVDDRRAAIERARPALAVECVGLHAALHRAAQASPRDRCRPPSAAARRRRGHRRPPSGIGSAPRKTRSTSCLRPSSVAELIHASPPGQPFTFGGDIGFWPSSAEASTAGRSVARADLEGAQRADDEVDRRLDERGAIVGATRTHPR